MKAAHCPEMLFAVSVLLLNEAQQALRGMALATLLPIWGTWYQSREGVAPHVAIPKRPSFRAVQFPEQCRRNRRRVQERLLLCVKEAELFWIERNRDNLTKLQRIMGNIKERQEFGIGVGNPQLSQRLALVPFSRLNLCLDCIERWSPLFRKLPFGQDVLRTDANHYLL